MASYKLNLNAKADLRRIYIHGFYHFGEAKADIYIISFSKNLNKLQSILIYINLLIIFELVIDVAFAVQIVSIIE